MDAGHLLARGMGGAREEINLVQMVADLNRGHSRRSLVGGNSVRHIELEIERALRSGQPGQRVSLDVRVRYGPSGRPTDFLFKVDQDGRTLDLPVRVPNR